MENSLIYFFDISPHHFKSLFSLDLLLVNYWAPRISSLYLNVFPSFLYIVLYFLRDFSHSYYNLFTNLFSTI